MSRNPGHDSLVLAVHFLPTLSAVNHTTLFKWFPSLSFFSFSWEPVINPWSTTQELCSRILLTTPSGRFSKDRQLQTVTLRLEEARNSASTANLRWTSRLLEALNEVNGESQESQIAKHQIRLVPDHVFNAACVTIANQCLLETISLGKERIFLKQT